MFEVLGLDKLKTRVGIVCMYVCMYVCTYLYIFVKFLLKKHWIRLNVYSIAHKPQKYWIRLNTAQHTNHKLAKAIITSLSCRYNNLRFYNTLGTSVSAGSHPHPKKLSHGCSDTIPQCINQCHKSIFPLNLQISYLCISLRLLIVLIYL
jgi:hypothetical protein